MGPLTKKQWKKYKKATKCHICYKPFTQTNLNVRDHCHYTGLYRGPIHSLCNLRYKIPSYIPVVFHNLSGTTLICLLGNYSLSPGVWQSFVTIRSCNHIMRIISRYVDNTKKSEIS